MGDASSKDAGHSPSITPSLVIATGNALFEKAVAAIGLDPQATRWLLVLVLKALGSTPQSLTPDELGLSLPLIEQRLRHLVLPDQAVASMTRLQRVLFDAAESGPP